MLTEAVRRRVLSRARHAVQPDHRVPAHVSGPDPQRLLIVGAETAAGFEARTDDLTLPGNVARAFAILSGRGIDVDVVAGAEVSITEALAHLDDPAEHVARYSAVIVSVGAAEVLSLFSERRWAARLHLLLSTLSERIPDDGRIVLILPRAVDWPPYVASPIAARLEGRAARWSAVAQQIAAGYPRATALQLPPRISPAGTPWRVGDYTRWGRSLAGCLYSILPVDTRFTREETFSDDVIHRAVDSLSLGEGAWDGRAGEAVSRILHSARDWFGADAVAFTVIDGDDIVVVRAVGLDEGLRTPRAATPCDTTVRRPAGHVVPRLDDHAAYRPLAHALGFHFYAGYRVEAPSGLPVGTLCLYRTEADGDVTEEDMIVLRDLAWRLSLALGE